MSNTINSSYVDQISKEEYFRIPLIVRECEKNADRHKAENMIVFIIQEPEDRMLYISVATDAEPFESVDKIIESMKLNSGETGTQGCGLPASAMQAAGRPFDHTKFRLITYSNNFVVSCTAEPVDSNTNSYKAKIQEQPELIHKLQKIIGNFKFKNNKSVSVLHMFQWGSEKNPITKETLASFREFCPSTNISVQWCIRKNQIVNSC